ncbi:hypothetical protein FB566_2357 [Stackebrandtia endophytica]|uniref:Uncharacterized protein n=1 Tax=Stackebrandtia endophytica TaxID=1496996 RepID=A0A543AW54_9ACTN|nr:hypothetical protein [Stackebrandtia endophytica]TQL76817.1 hypothetical protein FB566_2357 [Stackebrandtia endophytica]
MDVKQKQAEAFLVLMHKVMSDYEDTLADIKANDLVKAFNVVGEHFKDDPQAVIGAWSMLMEIIASTNKDNTEFLEKMQLVMSLGM